MSRPNLPAWFDVVEMTAALALTAGLAGLQVVFFLRGGGLFQDEVATVNIAQLPTAWDVWEHLQYDTMPAVWLYVLRAWAALGFTSDRTLRVPGLMLGLLVLAALWTLARLFGCRTPLIALAFVELNTEATRTICYIKPYGLGILLNLCFLACVWKCVESPAPRRWWWLCLAVGTLAAHTLYQDCFFILATLVAGMWVTLRQRAWKRTLAFLAMGLTILVSMTIYLTTLAKVADWSKTVELPAHFQTWSSFYRGMLNSMNPAGLFWLFFWVSATMFCLICSLIRWRRQTGMAISDTPTDRQPSATDHFHSLKIAFLLTVILAAANYIVFFAVAKQHLNPRYFTVFFAYVAVPAEALLLVSVNAHAVTRVLRLAVVVYACWAFFEPAWKAAAYGESQMIDVVKLIEEDAAPTDLIVITPWAEGIIFNRYFHGPNRWFTIPPLDDYRVHRSDLLKQRMQEDDPTATLRAKIEEALKDKERVFFVIGNAIIVNQQANPVRARPRKPPLPYTEWNEVPYVLYWHVETLDLLLRHGLEQTVLCRASGEYRCPVSLICFQGWK